LTSGFALGKCKGGKSIEEKGAYFLVLLFFIRSIPGFFRHRFKRLTKSEEAIDEVNARRDGLKPY
jgi:hypothetical protein